MTTIINTPTPVVESADSGLGIIMGVILGLALIVLFFVYALPAIRGNNTATQDSNLNINLHMPANNTNTTPGY